jgi:tetratricopeptide (TPR) repeat protein
MTLNYLGYMLADKGIKLPEALKLIRKAVELEPMNGAYLDSLGWVYFKLGSTNWPRRTCARPSSATRPIPPSTTTWAICTRRPAASGWPPRSGSSRWPSTPKSLAADVEPGDVAKVQNKLESARVKLAKQESAIGLYSSAIIARSAAS